MTRGYPSAEFHEEFCGNGCSCWTPCKSWIPEDVIVKTFNVTLRNQNETDTESDPVFCSYEVEVSENDVSDYIASSPSMKVDSDLVGAVAVHKAITKHLTEYYFGLGDSITVLNLYEIIPEWDEFPL